MSTEPINYDAVIADLEAKKAHLESTIAALRAIAGLGNLGMNPTPNGPGSGASDNGKIAPDAFLGKSIPDAAKVHLANVRRKLSTQELMDAMEAGGLPGSKYSVVYSILRRRENQIGDIINIKGDWGLADWYPNRTKKPSKKGSVSESSASEELSDSPENIEGVEKDEAATA